MQSDERLFGGVSMAWFVPTSNNKVADQLKGTFAVGSAPFLRFTKAWFVLTVNSVCADQP